MRDTRNLATSASAATLPPGRRWHDLGIWGFGLGYFLFYIPYAFVIAAATRGGQGTQSVSGFTLLPASALATMVVMFGFITTMGWWAFAGRRRLLGLDLPWPSRHAGISGLGFALIVPTTTLAYTWSGISILLAVLMMRGGVLIMSPIVDVACGRRVRWFSWAALGLCATAWIVALSDVTSYELTWMAILNTALYLFGYSVRIPCMTRGAKCRDRSTSLRFFVEEQLVALTVLPAVLALLAVIGAGPIMMDLRHGFSGLLGTGAAGPALLLGLCYGGLAVCGTLIYLDARENTFCLPLNRCASILSVLVASWLLSALMAQPGPSTSQLAAAGITICALALLSPLHHLDRYAHTAWSRIASAAPARPALASAAPGPDAPSPSGIVAQQVLQRMFLFVCSGNTSRSPMAQAICRAELAALLGVPIAQLLGRNIEVTSAGLTARVGAPLSDDAARALEDLGLDRLDHTARNVTAEMARRAELVFCMTERQAADVRRKFPEDAHKVHRLDPDGDVDDPSGKGPAAFQACAARLRQLVQQRVAEFAIAS
jgi:protein-tyrosine-phosphatase